MIAADQVEPVRWSLLLAGPCITLATGWAGWRAWQGRVPAPFGPEPRYQTYFGAAHASLAFAAFTALLTVGEAVRALLGQDDDDAVFMAFSVAATVVLLLGVVYVLCYFWIGVPPALRPPYQREQRAVGADRPSRWHRLKTHR